MRLNAEHLDHALKVADAILYEGYLLYPYHKSAQKNQARFQFGVLMPPCYSLFDPCESSSSQTECLLEGSDDTEIQLLVRFLQMQRRLVQSVSPEGGELHDVAALRVDGAEYTSWDEAAEREQRIAVKVGDLLGADTRVEFHIRAGEAVEEVTDAGGQLAGRLTRRWGALDGSVTVRAERVAGPYQPLRLRVLVANDSNLQAEPACRDDGLRSAMIAAHSLIAAPGGSFLSLTDPPEWAADAVADCRNVGTWPVLAGPEDCRDLMLSSPVILYDHPEIAAESAGDLFDGTEIDEILTLRTLALTDREKQLARATDGRAAELIDRLEDLPPQMLERMHGAIRYLRAAPAGAAVFHPAQPGDGGGWPAPEVTGRPSVPWWDPGSDASVSPDTDWVLVDGVRIASGSRVVMQPGARRADAQDLFLAGREAIVDAVLHDVDGQVHLAVTPADDPAADLNRNHGRFLYFAPDEVRPLSHGGQVTEQTEGGER
jgi:hypothetical protein